MVRQYIEALPNNARGRMPTQTEVRASGRHDIRYALQVQCFLSVYFQYLLSLAPITWGGLVYKKFNRECIALALLCDGCMHDLEIAPNGASISVHESSWSVLFPDRDFGRKI